MEAAIKQGREGLRSADKLCDMFGSLTVEEDQDYSVPKGLGCWLLFFSGQERIQ